MFAAWGRFVYRFRWLVLGFSGVMLTASIVALSQGGTLQNTSQPGLEYARAASLIASQLPQPGGSSFDLIFRNSALTVQDPAFRAAMDSALALVSVKDDFPTARQYYEQLRRLVHSDQLTILATGNLAVGHDFDTILKADLQRAELVSLPLAAVLLLVVFATVVAALLPLGVGGLAVVGGLAGVGLLARVTDVSTYATNIVTLIGLGVAIDYSLFIVNRFREE